MLKPPALGQAVSHSKYSIPFTETVCVDDTACKNANAKCSALLIGIMKAAQNAEQTLKVAHANAASAKSDHEKAKIEKAAECDFFLESRGMPTTRVALIGTNRHVSPRPFRCDSPIVSLSVRPEKSLKNEPALRPPRPRWPRRRRG